MPLTTLAPLSLRHAIAHRYPRLTRSVCQIARLRRIADSDTQESRDLLRPRWPQDEQQHAQFVDTPYAPSHKPQILYVHPVTTSLQVCPRSLQFDEPVSS